MISILRQAQDDERHGELVEPFLFVNFPYIFFIFFLILSLLFIASCSTYQKHPDSGYAVASWYGPEFQGRPTSSGEIFDMNNFTCAHREYPFGTILKVTNISNNKSAECVVNDRGPFVPGRDIDLSYAVARKIGLTSTGKVNIMRKGRDDSYVKRVKYLSDVGPFTIQVGSFKEFSNASRLKAALELRYTGIYIAEVEIGGYKFYRVRIGRFRTKEEVVPLARALAQEGYSVFITGYEEKI